MEHPFAPGIIDDAGVRAYAERMHVQGTSGYCLSVVFELIVQEFSGVEELVGVLDPGVDMAVLVRDKVHSCHHHCLADEVHTLRIGAAREDCLNAAHRVFPEGLAVDVDGSALCHHENLAYGSLVVAIMLVDADRPGGEILAVLLEVQVRIFHIGLHYHSRILVPLLEACDSGHVLALPFDEGEAAPAVLLFGEHKHSVRVVHRLDIDSDSGECLNVRHRVRHHQEQCLLVNEFVRGPFEIQSIPLVPGLPFERAEIPAVLEPFSITLAGDEVQLRVDRDGLPARDIVRIGAVKADAQCVGIVILVVALVLVAALNTQNEGQGSQCFQYVSKEIHRDSIR